MGEGVRIRVRKKGAFTSAELKYTTASVTVDQQTAGEEAARYLYGASEMRVVFQPGDVREPEVTRAQTRSEAARVHK